MNPSEMASLFSSLNGFDEARSYLNSERLLTSIEIMASLNQDRILPDLRDLARLHLLIRSRRVFTVLEFGVGFSTVVMADALYKNYRDWEDCKERPVTRSDHPFKLFSVDTEERWIHQLRSDIPPYLLSSIVLHHSPASSYTFQGRSCHVYDSLPNIVPDFVYLDGPDHRSVRIRESELLGGNQPHRRQAFNVPLAADLLLIEPLLLPGTAVVVDGRVSNSRFLAHHFYRNWVVDHCLQGDVTVFELQESPIGTINRTILNFCLGQRVSIWPDPML